MDDNPIRKIELNDLNRIAELEKRCFNENNSYNIKQLKYLIKNANSSCLAETNNNLIRGFIIVLYKNGTKVAGIETLNVDPSFRGNGVGRKLLAAAEEEMYHKSIIKARLEVSSGNIPAIRLYEKSGFRKTAILKNYYKYQYFGTNDAFRMVKELVT